MSEENQEFTWLKVPPEYKSEIPGHLFDFEIQDPIKEIEVLKEQLNSKCADYDSLWNRFDKSRSYH